MDQSKQSPNLYLVATPIGNLSDVTYRSVEILKNVDAIYCEDTRITSRLLNHYKIDTVLRTYHEHNAEFVRPRIIESMQNGETYALVSDAGTPLISDPGYKLVFNAYEKNLKVSIIPGATASISALAVSGLPTDKFKFCGFLPNKSNARQTALSSEKEQSCTLIYYESAKRLVECLKDIQKVFGDRKLSVIRELTKKFEEVKNGPCSKVLEWYQENPPLGEIVICVSGNNIEQEISSHWKEIISDLMESKKSKELSQLISEISPYSKSKVYEYVIECKQNKL